MSIYRKYYKWKTRKYNNAEIPLTKYDIELFEILLGLEVGYKNIFDRLMFLLSKIEHFNKKQTILYTIIILLIGGLVGGYGTGLILFHILSST